jgi:hypothetical protein
MIASWCAAKSSLSTKTVNKVSAALPGRLEFHALKAG